MTRQYRSGAAVGTSTQIQVPHECEQSREIERLQRDTDVLKDRVATITTDLAVFTASVKMLQASTENLQRSIETNREFMQKLLERTDSGRDSAQRIMVAAIDDIVNKHGDNISKMVDSQIEKMSDNYAKTTEKILAASADAIAKAVKTTLNDPSVQQIRTDGVSRKDAVEAAKLQETVKTLKVLVYGFVGLILVAAASFWVSQAVRSPITSDSSHAVHPALPAAKP